MHFIAQLTNHFYFGLALGLTLLTLSIFWFEKWKHWLLLWGSFLFLQGLVWGTKYLIASQRPIGDHAISNPSFPSGVAADAGFVATCLTILYPKYAFLWHSIGIFVASLRVYVGAHYIWDVVGGYLLGVLVVLLVNKWTDFSKFNHD